MIEIQPYTTPEDIEARSFALIDAEVQEPRRFVGEQWSIARRMLHTTADMHLLDDIIFSETAIDAGVHALYNGASIYTDTTMAIMGISKRYLAPFSTNTACILSLDGVTEKAQKENSTRSRAGMFIASALWENSIIGIGNAPTALLALTELLRQEHIPKPALVLAMPVGFVNATESKMLFCASCPEIPYITITGRKGGSTLLVATINALALIAIERKGKHI